MVTVRTADWGSLLCSRRAEALIHDSRYSSDPFQIQGVPVTPAQHRVQFRLPLLLGPVPDPRCPGDARTAQGPVQTPAMPLVITPT